MVNVANQTENAFQVKVHSTEYSKRINVTNNITGIAFRHAQNAGFSGAGGKDLANFYKYRQKFENTYFLPVPKERKLTRLEVWHD